MALAYTPPGVNVQEIVSPSTSPLLAVPASVCLVGLASGNITKTEAVVMTGTTPQNLTGVPSDATMTSSSIVSIIDAIDPSIAPSGYTVTTDYTFSNANHTVTRVNTGTIPDGNTVYVTYTYVPADYFTAIRLDNLADVQDRFGNAYDTTGTTVNSPLSYAAMMAFENGASNIVLQPLFFLNAGVKQQPTAVQNAASSTWSSTFVALRDIEDINIIVPVVGQSQANVGDSNQISIIQTVQDHVFYMRQNQQYIVGIVGEDSSAANTVAQKPTLITHANTVAARYAGQVSQQMVYVAPSKFSRQLPSSNGVQYLGGQYVASAVAGMIAARSVSQSLTRKVMAGFTAVVDPRTKAEKNTDAQNGLLVVEQKGTLVQVRHGITLDTTTTPARELSIVRAKHRLIESVRDTLENQVIGNVVADGDAPFFVAAVVVGVLEALRGNGDIVDFDHVQSRTLTLDPTAVEVRFSYKPSFPVNYVSVIFALDLTGGGVTIASTTTSNSATF